jgi:Uma2 family endonuclease
MTDLLNELLNDPTLPETVATLTARLDMERQRRALFYNEMTPDQKVEFIHGDVIVHSPSRSKLLKVTGRLFGLLDAYVQVHQLGYVASEKALCVFPRNDYEPDVVFFGCEKAALIAPDTLKFPIPDFICEVLSDSTEARDRGLKFKDYAAHGVSEYWLVDTEQETVEQFVLSAEGYFPQAKTTDDQIVSPTIAGFSIAARALFDPAVYLWCLNYNYIYISLPCFCNLF